MKTAAEPTDIPTLAQLPGEELALVRSVLNAVNRARLDLALNHKRDDARPAPIKATKWPPELLAMLLKHAGAGFEEYDKEQIRVAREALTDLAHGKLLSDHHLHEFAENYEVDKVADRDVRIRGRNVDFVNSVRFRSPTGAVAYALLRLVQLSAKEPALLRCEECETFVLIEATGGRHMTKFCSPRCRNRFNARDRRRSNPSKPAMHK
jgi:hypothetical protein